MDRRDFLKLTGLTALMTSCSGRDPISRFMEMDQWWKEDVVISPLKLQEGPPRTPEYVKTTCLECPAGCGIEARIIDGRFNLETLKYKWPVKLEGIKGHPINDGKLCVRGQASILRMYHPGRLKKPLLREGKGFREITWGEAISRIASALGGKSFYVSSRKTGTLDSLLGDLSRLLKVQKLPYLEFYSHSNLRKAYEILFGLSEVPTYKVDKADFLLTVGADLFETFLSPVHYARQYGKALRDGLVWYHVDPTYVYSKNRFRIRAGSEPFLLSYLLRELLRNGKGRLPPELSGVVNVSEEEVLRTTGLKREELRKITEALLRAKRPLVIAGGVSLQTGVGLETGLLAGLIQWATGAINTLVDFSVVENYEGVSSVGEFVSAFEDTGGGEVLFISQVDLVNTLPSSVDVEGILSKFKLKVALSDFPNDTTDLCDLVLPLTHPLEQWDDTEPRKGLLCLVRPASPKRIFDTKSEGEILCEILSSRGFKGFEDYREYMRKRWRSLGEDVEERLLRDGYCEVSRRKVRAELKGIREALENIKNLKFRDTEKLVLTPSLRFYDGRSRVNPLLSEIPDPLTTISYGRWISVSPEYAKKKGLKEGQVVEVKVGREVLSLPVKVQIGLVESTATVQKGVLASAILFDQISMKTRREKGLRVDYGLDPRTGEPVVVFDLNLKKLNKFKALPILTGSYFERGRGILPHPEHHKRYSILQDHEHEKYLWAMAVDTSACIGCSACVAACYKENNVPLVGEVEHLKNREMAWIRLEPYYDTGQAQIVVMLCQQCEKAPCEYVCPAFATMHSEDGVNQQVYNRCVGTRFCANNCPYKVRKFNWFRYRWDHPLDKMINPDVWIRPRGVMEKCNFCYQRIKEAYWKAKLENREVRDGEVVPACVQTCPTDALVFGNLKDENSRISRVLKEKKTHRIYEHLNTDPSVYYIYEEEGHERKEL